MNPRTPTRYALPLLRLAPQVAVTILVFCFHLDTYSLGVVCGVCLMGMWQTIMGPE